MKKRLRWVIGIILGAAFLYSGYRMIPTLAEYAQSEAVKQEVVRQAVVIADEQLPAATGVAERAVGETAAEVPLEKPPITVDFAALQEINPEIIGWLYCADTPINYPVAYTDNNTYYLNHLFDGTRNHSGTLFVDYRCSPDFSDMNTVIYGHHMKSGAMFACLVEYESQDYYEAHPAMYLLTPEHNYRLDILSGYVAESGSQRLFSKMDGKTELEAYLNEIIDLSDFDADADSIAQDRIVTLSTCTYDFDEARYIVHAFVTEIG